MSQIDYIECRHVTYTENRNNDTDDAVFVKEVIHLKDGTVKPNLRLIENPKRPFYLTKKPFQNHEQKKMFEKVERLKRFTTNQRNLAKRIAKELGYRNHVPYIKELARSPYLYGSDVPIESIVKETYREKWPNEPTPNTLAVLDIETTILDNGNPGDPVCSAITFKDKAYLSYDKNWFTSDSAVQQIHDKFNLYLGDIAKERNITLEVEACDNPGITVQRCIEKAHEWMPDFLVIWNINFDIPKILDTLKKYQISPYKVFSDPSVPPAYRKCYYKEGPSRKVSAKGVVTALSPAERWHTLYAPASFYVIDGMCLYKQLRAAKGLEPSYSLDAILQKELGTRKLKFREADHLASQVHWHNFMRTKYKAEYCVYNLFDCIGVEQLEEKILDIPITISILSRDSNYDLFPRQPRRICNQLHFKALKKGYVIGSTSDQMASELDTLCTSTEGWIITLDTKMIADVGLKILKGLPNHSTRIMTHTADSDVSSSYPRGGIANNIESSTTLIEPVKIEGVSERTRRRASLNLTAARVNGYEISVDIYKAPTADVLLDQYREWKKNKA